MAVTALDVITFALIQIGEVGQGEPISAEDAAYCLTQLNTMLDSWSIERLNIYTVLKQQVALTAGLQDYTVGPTGTFTSIGRPTEILAAASYVVGTSVTRRLNILDFGGWIGIPSKSASDTIPTDVYLDQAYPNSGLHFWPIPNTNCPVDLYYMAALPQFTSLTQAFLFPPGYQQALTYNLCLLIADGYSKPIQPTTANEAIRSKAALQNMNMETLKSFFGESRTLQGAAREGPLPQQAAPTAGPPQG